MKVLKITFNTKMYKWIIDNNEGDITLQCKDGEVKAISFILKKIDVISSILSGKFNDSKIELFKEYSVNATKYFLNHLYVDDFKEIPDICNERLLIYFETMRICDKLCAYNLNEDIFEKILKCDNIFLERQIYKILNDYANKKVSMETVFFNKLIDFLIKKIESKDILINNLDIPIDHIKIIFDKILTKHEIYELLTYDQKYDGVEDDNKKTNDDD